jgi:hypothetical protein
MDVYESFVLQTVACEDDTRAVAQQSLCIGWKTESVPDDGLNNPLQVQNDNGTYPQTHGPTNVCSAIIPA